MVSTSSSMYSTPHRTRLISTFLRGTQKKESPISLKTSLMASPSSLGEWSLNPSSPAAAADSALRGSPVLASPSLPASSTASASTASAVGALQAPSPLPSLTPTEMACMGYHQNIVIPMRLMLKKVMASIKSPIEPIFGCLKLWEYAYIGHVQLDVSTTQFAAHETEPIISINGQECATVDLAEESAAINAFEYLAKRHFVVVLDYSKRLAARAREKAPFRHVNSVIHHVEDAMDALHESIAHIEKFHCEVHAKEYGETTVGYISPSGSIYKELRESLKCFMEKYDEKYKVFLCGVKVFEDERIKYKDESMERVTKWANKGLRQAAWFTEKDVLEYVIAYFGLSEPEYWKEYIDETYIGYVKIKFPELDELNCCGNTVFRGYGSSSSIGSEKEVAAVALKEIERIFNVTIVDFNHADRLAAEKEHNCIVSLLENIIDLAEKVKNQCTDMVETMNSACEVYGAGPEKFKPQPLANDQVCALNFCAQGLASLQSLVVKKLECVVAKIDHIQKYCPDEA